MNEREIALKVAWHYLGTPYIWAGDDPSGFDCSGLVIECLKSSGILPRKGDWTAAALFKLFRWGWVDGSWRSRGGDLVFWHRAEDKEAIIHVEMMIDSHRSIGASGGGAATTTIAEAWRANAFVKIRPIVSRPHCAGILNPYKD